MKCRRTFSPLSYRDVAANRETFFALDIDRGPAWALPLSPSQWAPLSANGNADDEETTDDHDQPGRGVQSRVQMTSAKYQIFWTLLPSYLLSCCQVLATLSFPKANIIHLRGGGEGGPQPLTKNKTWLLPSASPARGRNDQVLRGVSL